MKPTTISLLQKCKQEKKRFATITAYDYSFAKLFAEEGINVMLVGDSLGMTVQGHDSTLPVTVADIAYHTQAVRRGAPGGADRGRAGPVDRRARPRRPAPGGRAAGQALTTTGSVAWATLAVSRTLRHEALG